MSKNVVILPGDGMDLDYHKPLINYLSDHGFSVFWIELMEETKPCSYQDLEPDNYCKYINDQLPSNFDKFYAYGISKGCYWWTVYASKYPGRIINLLLIEPTTMKPDLLREFELDRGNDFIQELYDDPSEVTREDNTHTALDVIVSDKRKFVPKCRTTIVWTSRNNKNEPYDSTVIRLKKQYENWLRLNGCHLKVLHVDDQHCLDQNPKNFPYIMRALLAAGIRC